MEKRPRLRNPPCVYKRQKLRKLLHVYQRRKLMKLPCVYQRRKRLELPPELIQQILIRLPVKSLRRFRCVSKPWSSLIDDPGFQKQNAEHRASQSPLLLVAKNDQDSTHALFSTYSNDGSLLKEFSKRIPKSDRVDDNEKITFWLIGHCKGLICFRLQFEGSLHVCNPSTEEMISLPLKKRKGNRPSDDDDICVGFGYAASIKKFKVVKIYQRDFDEEQCSCKIFTLGSSDGWRRAEDPPFFPNWGATFLHGALHFLPDCDARQYDSEYDDYIAAFDLDNEKYRKYISLPRKYFQEHTYHDNKSRVPVQLAELRGSLFLAFELVKDASFKLELLFLKDYPSGKWVKAYMINLSPVVSSIKYYNWTTPLAILRDGTILVNVCSSKKDEVCCYTTEGKRIGSKIGGNCWAVSYDENPLPLGSR